MTAYALLIDTALEASSVGLYAQNGADLTCLYAHTEAMTRGHQEYLGNAVSECFERSGIEPKFLSVIMVTLGPGSFTGLRVGLAFAKGMAGGLNIPLRGVSTLEAMGRRAEYEGRARLIAHAAGRGQVYSQTIGADDRPYPLKALNIDDLSALSDTPEPAFLIGSGAPLLAEFYPNSEVIPEALPDLEAMARLAFKDTTAYDDLTPLYMRDADAKVSDKAVIRFDF